MAGNGADDELLRTPLHDLHVEAGATMVDFAGWRMPIRYDSIIDEHHAVRNAAGLFDLGHMGRIRIGGVDRVPFLDRLVTNVVEGLGLGAARYALLPTEDGGVIDDVIYYVRAEEIFLVCNATNRETVLDWLQDHATAYAVDVRDRTTELGMIALQGPEAASILARRTDLDLSRVKNYQAAEDTVCEVPALVARTGYTGEDGFELYVPAPTTVEVWTSLLEAGADADLVPCGLGARDTLRTEAAMPLYGHEIDRETDPIAAGLSFAVKLEEKGEFVGRDPIERVAEEGPARRLVCFEVEGRRIARPDSPILDADGERIGRVTSGTMSPTLDRPIGMGYVLADRAEPGTELVAEVRGREIPIRLVKRPFYRRDR